MTSLKQITFLAVMLVVMSSLSEAQRSSSATQVVTFGVRHSNSVQLTQALLKAVHFISNPSEAAQQTETTLILGSSSDRVQKLTIALVSRKSLEQRLIRSKTSIASHDAQLQGKNLAVFTDEVQDVVVTVTD